MAPVGLSDTCVIALHQDEHDSRTPSPSARQTVKICRDNDTQRIKLIIRRLSFHNHKVFPWRQISGIKRKAESESNAFVNPKKTRPADRNAKEYTPDINEWVPQLGLQVKDRVILTEGDWLTDNHIVAAQLLLRRQFPALEGLQEPVLGNVLQFKPIVSDGVQVILNGNSHWVTFRKVGAKIKVMDSKNMGLTKQLTHQVINLCRDDEGGTVEVRLPMMHRQRGSSDCGVFALAYATEVAFQGNPELVVYEQKRLRQHLEACLEVMKMSPFPKKVCKERTPREIGQRTQVVQKIPPSVTTVVESTGIERSP